MPGKSTYLTDALLNHVLRGVAFPTLPANVFAGLHTADPTDAGGVGEVTGGAYARVSITRATGSFAVPADNAGVRRTSNSAVITYPTPTAAWGYIGFQSLSDAVTAGNLLYSAPIGPSTTLVTGITAGATSLTVASAAGFPTSGNYVILHDAERMLVTAGQGTTTWTMTRAYDGTTAAAHSAGSFVIQPRLINSGDTAPSFAISAMSVDEG